MNVSALYHGELVGMGRLVGDGAMYWYLQEIIVVSQFQRKGIGSMIVNYLVDYARAKEPFYEKLGFAVIPNGIKKMIEL